MRPYHPIIIGLTGGIATGKSTVLKIFKQFGAKIIDADKIAHRIIQRDTPEYKKILKSFGLKILNSNKEINRKKLAKIIFANDKKRKILEKITHPKIISEIKLQLNHLISQSLNHLIVIDAPLLFEKKLNKLVDKTVVVYVPEEIQIKRLMKRNGISKKEAIKRISTQLPIEYKKKLADYIIDGSCSITSIKEQIKKIFFTPLTNKK